MTIVIFVLIILIWIYCIFLPPIPHPCEKYDYALLLGCPSHNDGSYSTSQIKRCELAIKDYKKGKFKTLVIAGGAVKNKYFESIEMKKYILERIDMPIICETESRNTIENFQYSKEIIKDHSVLILTSVTHAKRAAAIAREYFSVYSADYYYYARARHIYREIGARYFFIKDQMKKKWG